MRRFVLFAVVVAALAAVTGSAFAAGPYSYYPLTPCRIADTRNSTGSDAAAPALVAYTTRQFTVKTKCGVPSDAAAVTMNVAITQATDRGRLTLFPSSLVSVPNVSTINFQASDPALSNGAIVPLNTAVTTLDLSVYCHLATAGSVHMILDVTGYFK